MRWASFETVGHSSKNLVPSQETLRLLWCPNLVTGLSPSSEILLVKSLTDFELQLHALQSTQQMLDRGAARVRSKDFYCCFVSIFNSIEQ